MARNLSPENPSLSNFRWIIPDELAGSALPLSVEAVHKAGIDTVISFVSPEEQLFVKEGWQKEAKARGIDFHTIDIQNLSVPTKKQFQHFLRLMDSAQARKRKPKVLVHCLMGVGRTGTMAAAYLIARKGLYLEDAYKVILRGLRGTYYDSFATKPKFLESLRAKGISLKQFLRDMPFHFPESRAQENFLKIVERNYRLRNAHMRRRVLGKMAFKPKAIGKRRL
jgi:atypical dual specificity phosphatase